MDDILKYYEILGLKLGATEEQIKQAHRDLAKVWHPDRFPNDPRLQEKAQEKLKEINLAYDYLRSHRYTPPPEDEKYQEEEPAPEEKPEPEEPPTTYTPTYKPYSFFSSIPKWVMIVIALALIRALYGYLNTTSKPQKAQYKPPLYYPLPSTPVSPAIELPPVTEKQPQKPVTKPLTKPSPQTSKVSPKPTQDEVLKEKEASENISQISEEDSKHQSVKEQIQKIEGKLEEYKKDLSQLPDKVASLPPPQPSVSRNYFTVGSSKKEVLAVQGTPTSIVGESWYYSYSTVIFYNGRVCSYSDTSRNLRVKMAPKPYLAALTSADYFTLDSTQDEVLAVQGTPTSIIGETWYYSYSTINFYNGRVRGYSNTSKNLHVKVLPKSESSLTSKGYFTLDSTQDEVLAVQGTPSSIIGETWYYSYSTINFYKGRVKGYSNTSHNLKVKLE